MEISFSANFNQTNDRIWVGKEFWAVPLEDWQVHDGRIECLGNRPEMKVNLLTNTLKESGDAKIVLRMGIYQKNTSVTKAGIRLGVTDKTDISIPSLCYFGKGIDVGVSTEGYMFIGDLRKDLSKEFDYTEFTLEIDIEGAGTESEINLIITDKNSNKAAFKNNKVGDLKGLIALVNYPENGLKDPSHFWFDDLSVSGTKVKHLDDTRFGPILWPMYTLSKGVLKMSVQMPPLGKKDNHVVDLEIENDGVWKFMGSQKINTDSKQALFKILDWDDSKDYNYRLVYNETYEDKIIETNYYPGTIRKDPKEKAINMGALSCQFHYGFPYTPIVNNLKAQNPDILFFAGDQIYEGNGGYGIIRFPENKAITNYLGKWYMFGWAFGDLMRDRPTVCIPDDHEFFQGNLWGNGGEKISIEDWNKNADAVSGFVQTSKMANVIIGTNSAHLPDPFDAKPMKQGINVFYTDLVYGRVSFAIVGDRVFKSGPEEIKSPELEGNYYRGNRLDLIINPIKNTDVFEKPNLEFLGDRQMKFLEHWAEDWDGADMKVLLSETLFCNNTTHYGSNKELLFADLDSGGWPKPERDRALKTIRKCAAYHITGDQHLPAMIQYGADTYQDAGWAFCMPAITVVYQRRFLPDTLGWKVVNRPKHNYPNTGYYKDGFGNPSYVYAVGNPEYETNDLNRFKKADKSSSGYGLVNLDSENRTIRASAYKFLVDVANDSLNSQFPGWPKTTQQIENFGKTAVHYLPSLKIKGISDAVVKIYDEENDELALSIRIKGNQFSPKVFKKGTYKIVVGSTSTDTWKTFTHLKTASTELDPITIEF